MAIGSLTVRPIIRMLPASSCLPQAIWITQRGNLETEAISDITGRQILSTSTTVVYSVSAMALQSYLPSSAGPMRWPSAASANSNHTKNQDITNHIEL